ncbi:MAG TPA: DUF5664 domain-containing protein [Clostridiales bacterium]|nr:DUF5664 domain-containing protein [Clostridiales bacterium]
MAELKDSGARRDFGTGAVRDMADGKGRCDLLPLDIIADQHSKGIPFHDIFFDAYEFTKSGDVAYLLDAIDRFCESVRWGFCTMLLEVAKQFEDGAKKYGDNNWRKGIPVNVFLDSALRHYIKFCRGDNDEPHDRAVCWNLLCAIWTCKHKPELNPYKPTEDKIELNPSAAVTEQIKDGGIE